ncbi:Smr/MutS family protein [Enterovirga aerilata]|uniref:DNA mismatch repair protein MutS n=1 Tax=Enterovirga aerilata TaxID=2730920 RepID=A0A849I2R7_9HYPH|nr:Smr/MutS family protein [Enterovirga sp. DB1703]NNM73682.1 DNA mismatch repair protein MutS [Enterovirga sp. DB1703]
MAEAGAGFRCGAVNRGPRRLLSSEERRLWAEVAKSVAPLPGRALPTAPELRRLPDAASASPSEIPAAVRIDHRPQHAEAAPLAPIEPKTRRALARGRARPDAVIDLHGMTQAEAHAALLGFLRRAQASGRRLVLIVTGKGRAEDVHGSGDRGVLRRVVPHWLGLPELRPLVLGWTEAAPRQGGSGALYVRLRRPATRA